MTTDSRCGNSTSRSHSGDAGGPRDDNVADAPIDDHAECARTKIRDGQVANRPIYVVLGINCDGERDVLGLWVGTGGEGAKHWMAVLSELKNRGVADVCIVACDGLKGLPQAIGEVWPLATVQTCVVHLVRATLRYASKAHWSAITKSLRTVYTASTVEAAEARFGEFETEWGERYPAIIRLWRSSWEQFTPFLGFPAEIRKVIYTTDEIVNPLIRLWSCRWPDPGSSAFAGAA
jgi:putative transposase